MKHVCVVRQVELWQKKKKTGFTEFIFPIDLSLHLRKNKSSKRGQISIAYSRKVISIYTLHS